MPKTILVVDDEEDILQLLRYNLEKEGYAVRTASNGAQALEVAEKGPLDLILLDVMMPEVDGFEVCRKLRATPLHAVTPIMFLTAPRWWMAATGTAIMTIVAIWLWRRPEPPSSPGA